jgi:hypothetical protein
MAFPAILLAPEMGRTMTEGALHFTRAHLSLFANVRGFLIMAALALEFAMNAHQREGRPAVVEVAVAIAAGTRDRLVQDRLAGLAVVVRADQRVALPAADTFMKKGQ